MVLAFGALSSQKRHPFAPKVPTPISCWGKILRQSCGKSVGVAAIVIRGHSSDKYSTHDIFAIQAQNKEGAFLRFINLVFYVS